MNRARRKSLADIHEQLEVLQERLTAIAEEEAECRDNMPENLQTSKQYKMAEQACDALESACDAMCELLDCIEDAAGDEREG